MRIESGGRRTALVGLCAGWLSVCTHAVQAGEWSGHAGIEYQGFIHEPLFAEQHRSYFSVFAQPEYRRKWDNDKQGVTFVAFARASRYDEERTHADIRELSWFSVGEGYEWRVGIRKLFWGVVESQHLVDIVNQTDLVENLDGEEKLGQPMINLALVRGWGTLDLFVLPGFRERRFPGKAGRLRTALAVDTGQAVYQSGRGRRRVDFAARWHKSIGAWEVGVSQFSGTARDPRLVPGVGSDGQPALIPYYDVIDQTGLDVQATAGAWLWKLEAIRRNGQGPSYLASTAGFEYTVSGIFDSAIDLGVLAEYLHDDRGKNATTPFQDDVFAGLRFAFNDAQSSELLFGLVQDRQRHARLFNVEANRRIGRHFKLSLEARAFAHIPPDDPFFGMRRDDYVQLELARYF